MNASGHNLTAIAFGGVVVSSLYTGYLQHPYQDASLLLICLFWFAGIVVGASAPDWLELSHVGRDKKRHSLIPHRTLTHWPVLWVGLGYWVLNSNFNWMIECAMLGFVASSLLHILMDSLSKSGVPILLPFAKFRMRIPLYSTGRFSEVVMIALVFTGFSFLTYFLMKEMLPW